MRLFFFLLTFLVLPLASAAELRELRVWDGPETTTVVFELDGKVAHKLFTLANPDRLVVDVDGLDAKSKAAISRALTAGVVRSVRSGPREGGLRVVFDLNSPVTTKSSVQEPTGQYGYRLVVDLYGPGAKPPKNTASAASAAEAPKPVKASPPAVALAAPVAEPPAATVVNVLPPVVAVSPSTPRTTARLLEKQIVVAVDAGHGGEDPGALGRTGLREKDVSLSVARKLAAQINAQPGMRAVLTRDGDYYVGLRERVVKARAAQADLFVSVHCNAYKDTSLRGSAVYVLSDRGATSEQSRWLASKENSADMVGGIDLGTKDHELAAVLIDLSQSSTMEASFDLGGRLLSSLSDFNALQKPVVQQAGFAVLKAPDIPSVLVETAFITNAEDERLLADTRYHDKMARSLLAGIQGYFKTYRPQQQVAIADEEPRLQKVSAKAKPVATSSRRVRNSKGIEVGVSD